MVSIFIKEINSFFSSLIGYLAIIAFLMVTGLFLWIVPFTSILDYGFASLENLFETAPYILMFLIPAITMRTFSEEKHSGTIELLVTRPLRDFDIIFGKYLASFTLVLFSILPTLIYFFTVYQLGIPKGNIDTGGVWGSYIGLLLLSSAFVSIGLFCSVMSSNQIVSFIIGVSLCFFLFLVLDYLSDLDIFLGTLDNFVQQLGMKAHYDSLSRGVIDTRDVVYFLSVNVVFLLFTKISLESRKW